MTPKERAIDVESRLSVIEIVLARQLAEGFADQAAMRAWTNQAEAQVATIIDRRTDAEPLTTAAYQRAWDNLLASVRTHWQMLRARKTGG